MKRSLMFNRIFLMLLCLMLVVPMVACGDQKEAPKAQNQTTIEPAQKKLSAGETLLQVTSYADYEAAVQEFALPEHQDFDWYFLDGISLMDQKFTFSFRFKDDEVKNKTASAVLSSSSVKLSAEELGNVSARLVAEFASSLGYTGRPYCMVFDQEGNMLDEMDPQTDQLMAEGKATIRMEIRQSSTSFWKIVIGSNGSEEICCTIEHFINDAYYEDRIGDINLD